MSWGGSDQYALIVFLRKRDSVQNTFLASLIKCLSNACTYEHSLNLLTLLHEMDSCEQFTHYKIVDVMYTFSIRKGLQKRRTFLYEGVTDEAKLLEKFSFVFDLVCIKLSC